MSPVGRTRVGAWPFCDLTLSCSILHALGFAEHPQTIAEHIKRRRCELGISQLELAKRLDACVYTVITWECHDCQPSFALWPGLMDFLGYDPYGEPKTLGECLSWLRRPNGLELPACSGPRFEAMCTGSKSEPRATSKTT